MIRRMPDLPHLRSLITGFQMSAAVHVAAIAMPFQLGLGKIDAHMVFKGTGIVQTRGAAMGALGGWTS